MEVTVLKGPGEDVQELADHVIGERGVRHGQVVYLRRRLMLTRRRTATAKYNGGLVCLGRFHHLSALFWHRRKGEIVF